MNKKITGLLLIMLSLIVIGAILLWSPVCTKLVEMANGNMTFMKCHYTANISIILSVLMIVVAIESIFKNTFRPLTIICIGLALILTTNSSLGIGMCMKASMPCNRTKYWIQIPGILMMLIGIYIGYKNKKSI